MKTQSTPPSSVSRALRILLVLLVGLLSACGPESDLKPGLAVEREIGGNESHTYRLPFEAGFFISLRIEQPGINVKARLVGPGGESIPVFDDPGDLEDPDRLAWISKTPGEYRLIVQARDPKTPRGRYSVELQTIRASRPADVNRVAAGREYSEGRKFLWGDESGRPQSLPCFEKALQLWEQSEDQAGQVDALVQIAEYYNLQGNGKEAVPFSERAVKLAHSIGYPSGEARAFQALANANVWLREWASAIESSQRAFERWQDLKDEGRQAAVLYSLGNIYSKQSQFDLAIESLERARSLRSNSRVAINVLVLLGNIQTDLGNTTRAIEICQQALKLSRSAKLKPSEAVALHCLGAAHLQRGEFETARSILEEVLAINIQLKALAYQPTIRQALGAVYFNLGDTDRTLLEYRRAWDMSQSLQDKQVSARLLTNTGFIYQAKGDPKRALMYYQRALPLHEEVENNTSGIALTLHNTGVAYTALKRPQEGLSYLQRALELRTNAQERSAQAGSLLEIGTAYRELGDLRQAADYFHRALDLARKVENTRLEAECLFRWSSLDAAEGRLPEALDKIKGALAIVESVRSGVPKEKYRTSFFASKRVYYELYVHLLMRLEILHPGQYRETALEASEWARARGLLDLLAEGNIHLQQGIDRQLRQREIELEGQLSKLQDQFAKTSTEGDSAFWGQRLERARTERVNLESQIRNQHQQYAEIRYPTPLQAKEIQGLLQDDDTALLQYFTGQQASYLFVVTRKSIESHRLPSRDVLTREVTDLREMLQRRMGRRDLNLYKTLASRLYQDLLGPAEASLRGKSHLLIAPDGPLYLLPFEALLTDAEGARSREFGELSYLLRRFAVSYIPSASVLRGLRSARPSQPVSQSAPKRFMAFADPVYGGGTPSSGDVLRSLGPAAQGSALVQLTDSRREVERIASLYPRNLVAIYVGSTATEENLKSSRWLPQANQIHIAAHGTVNERQPLLSGLELARIPGSKEDGTLRVEEIFNLRLNANLVTLSACKTALGQEVRGEGVVGMTRAFFYAGARSLLVSLWPVSDRSTPDLMYDFYRHLGATQGKAEALRRAKLAMVESENYAEPYFWAPFILSGDPR